MINEQIWPHDFDEMKKNRKGETVYVFKPVEVTIKRVFPPKKDGSSRQYGTGWTFEEDPTPNGEYVGVIWSHPGKWDGQVNAFVAAYGDPDPEKGLPERSIGSAGMKATAFLSVVEGDTRNFHNVQMVRLHDAGAVATPTAQGSSAPPPPPAGGDINERIHKQVGFKGAVELLCAKMGAAKTAYDPFTENEWKSLAADVWLSYNKLMIGDSPKLFMDEAIKAENGDTQVEDSEETELYDVVKQPRADGRPVEEELPFDEETPW